MKPQSMVLLAVAFVAAGASGCFKDPVKPLLSGPTTMTVSDQAIYLRTGDSVAVVAEVKDNQGNVLPATGAAWSATDATIAAVRMDTVVVPGNYFTRGFVRGVTPTGGWTTVIVQVGNVADTLRVTVLPANLTASLVSRSGAAKADTVLIPAQLGPPPVAAKLVAFTAPDTLVLSGTSVLNFDTSGVSVYANSPAGKVPGWITAKTPTQLKVVFTVPAIGKVVVKKLLAVTGNGNVGTIALDSLVTDSVAVSKLRFVGNLAQVGDTSTVNSTGPYDISAATVKVGTVSGAVWARTGTTALSFITLAVGSGDVTLYGAKGFGSTLDSIKLNGTATTTVAHFNGTIGQGNLSGVGDTINVAAGAPTTFSASTSVSFGAAAGIVPRVSASQLTALSPVNYTGQITVNKVTLGLATVNLTTNAGVPYTVAAAVFPNANVVMSPNNGKLGDTIIVTAPSGLSFSTGAKVSNVVMGNTSVSTSDTAWMLHQAADSLKVFPKRGGTGKVTVTNIVAGTLVIPKLTAPTAVPIDSVASDFSAAATKATARLTVVPVSNVDTVYGRVYCKDSDASGACFGTTAINDYYTFVTASPAIIGITIGWFGSGNPYGSGSNTVVSTADLDGQLCNAAYACDESGSDLTGNAAASVSQPEAGDTGTAQAAGQYWVGVLPFTGPYAVVYRLIIKLQ